MRVTQQPQLRQFWYPVLPTAQLQDQPVATQLLGQGIALWRKGSELVAAVEDRCPHRSARLSLGQITAGAIQCPYHGWCFNAAGDCVQVPQLESTQEIPASYHVLPFRCQERYGYVWICLGDPLHPLPAIPEADEPQYRLIPEFYEIWHCSGLRIMENSFDNAHFTFVHEGTLGAQSHPTPAAVEITDTPTGLQVRTEIQVFNPPEQRRNLGIPTEWTTRITERTWYLPFTYTAKITYPNGRVHMLVTMATPLDDQRSQFIQFCLRNDSETEAPSANVIAFDRRVTLEDKAILETTDWHTPLEIEAEQHMASDKTSILLRRKLAALLSP